MSLRLLSALFLLSTAAAAPMAAQMPTETAAPQRPMTFVDLDAMRRVSDPQISPSGKWVLFSVTDVSLEKNTKTNHLWVVAMAGGKERQLTSGGGESNGRFSPDGKTVLYSSGDAFHGTSNGGQIWLAAWDEAAGVMGAGTPVTSLETEADGAIWAPDSQHILFVSNVYPECERRSEHGAERNRHEALCNAADDAAAVKSPVKAQVWDHLLYRHWNAYQGRKHSHIFYAGIDGAAPTDLTPASVIGDHEAPTFSLGGPLGYAISPDGREVAYVVNLDKVPAESTNNDIFVLKVDAEPSTARKVSTSLGSDDGPLYSPDGRWLAWRSQARPGFEADTYRLMTVDRTNGKIEERVAKDGFDGSLDEFVWDPSSTFVFFTAALQGEEPLMGLQIGGGSEQRTLAVQGEFSGVQAGKDAEVAVRMTVNHPAEIVRFLNGESFQLTSLNESIVKQLLLAQMENFHFAGANGTRVQGFLIKPPNFDPAKKYPMKFLIHGGPQGAWGDAWSYRWNPELFAANGYVVVMINPRGSTGYGQKFVDEVSGDWGGRPYEDLMRGLDYVEKTYPFVDKTRECALGASYGGFMADYILTHTDRFACIVTHDGMYNPQSAFGTTEELWFNEWEFRPLQGAGSHTETHKSWSEGDAPEAATPVKEKKGAQNAVVEQSAPAHPWDFYDRPAASDPFRKFSPMLSIQNAKTPTLVIHGQKDYRLDVSEGLQLFTALQLRGVPSRMLYFPDEGHWVLKPQNSQYWYIVVNDWVDQWTHTNGYAGK